MHIKTTTIALMCAALTSCASTVKFPAISRYTETLLVSPCERNAPCDFRQTSGYSPKGDVGTCYASLSGNAALDQMLTQFSTVGGAYYLQLFNSSPGALAGGTVTLNVVCQ